MTKCLIFEHYLHTTPKLALGRLSLPGTHERQHYSIQLLVGKVTEVDIVVQRPMLDVLERGTGP